MQGDLGDGDDEEEDSDHDYQRTTMRPPPRNSSRVINNHRSSISSDDSILSSEDDSIVEQPAMALPSLKKNEGLSTPLPKIRTAYRARTSSLPRPPLMQRSSSMSTVETMTSPLSPLSDNQQEEDIDPSTQIYPPHMLINRPIVSRPSIGLGSMRRKAANRLSIEGFTVGRQKVMNQGFLQSEEQSPSQYSDHASQLKLLFALEKSMFEGAHITQKLYIPKNLW